MNLSRSSVSRLRSRAGIAARLWAAGCLALACVVPAHAAEPPLSTLYRRSDNTNQPPTRILELATRDIEETRKLFLGGEYTRVIEISRSAVADGEYSEEWRRLLADSLLRTGQYPEAQTVVSNALNRYFSSVRLRMLAHDAARSLGRTDEALDHLRMINQLVQTRTTLYRDAQNFTTIGRAILLLGADPKDVLDKIYAQAKTADPGAREPRLAIGDLALQKKDYALASKNFREGVAQFPADADFHYGLAASLESDDRAGMIASLLRALELNPNHVPARLLLADHAIAAEEYAEAERQLARALEVNPWQPEAWAYRAVLAHLRNEPDKETEARATALKFWTNSPVVEHLIGTQLSRKYRFAEGAAHQRRALEFDPAFVPARVQLAQDLLRLGNLDEGWALVEEAHQADPYDIESFNLATLRDAMEKFATLSNEFFIVRMSQKEAAVYGDRVMALLDRARTNLCEKYGLEITEPVIVEIFPDQKDFGVRTFGMPHNPGFLGVCFGRVITANSPASSAGNVSNWEAVLWHEFCHVVTLTLTRNKMPRWLSEGISVFEELQADPAWGQRMNPDYRERILGDKLTPIGELSSAFLTAEDGMALQFAYYQSALAVEFLVGKYGAGAIRQILVDLGQGGEINATIARHTAPMGTVEKEFAAFAKKRAESMAPDLEWKRVEPLAGVSREMMEQLHPKNFYILQQQARMLVRAQRWIDALEPLRKLRAGYPTQTGPESALALMAIAYRELGNEEKELEVLRERAAIDTEAIDTFSRLMTLAAERKDWAELARNAERYIAVNPLAPEPRRRLAEAYDALARPENAAGEWKAVLALGPADLAETQFRLAASFKNAGLLDEARRHVLSAIDEAPRYRAALALYEEINRSPKPQALP